MSQHAGTSVGTRWSRRGAALDAIPPIARTVDGSTLRETRRFRGLTVEQAIGYLEHLGGRRRAPYSVVGDDWTATLSAGTVPVGPSYRLTEVSVTWAGDRARLEPIIRKFRLKAFRAPG